MTRWFICISLFLTPFLAEAGVIFYDDITLKGIPYMLKAETRSGLFSRGGRMVEFIVDNRLIGRNLSGGDGFALKEFTPDKRGLYNITVRSEGEEDKGYLLSLNRAEGIVIIDIEGGIFEGVFPLREREHSKEAIRNISRRFPIVYLQTRMERELLERVLREKGFQGAPILRWEDGEVINRIYERGVRIKAFVGSSSLLESMEEYRFKAFSFEETEGAEWVRDWKEIEDRLR